MANTRLILQGNPKCHHCWILVVSEQRWQNYTLTQVEVQVPVLKKNMPVKAEVLKELLFSGTSEKVQILKYIFKVRQQKATFEGQFYSYFYANVAER